jgi:hypothetical protein
MLKTQAPSFVGLVWCDVCLRIPSAVNDPVDSDEVKKSTPKKDQGSFILCFIP